MTSLFRRKYLTILGFISAAGASTVFFQNCADLMPLAASSSLQSQFEYQQQNDQLLWNQLSASSTFQVWISPSQTQTSVTSLTQVVSNFVSGLRLTPAAATSGPTVVAGSGRFAGKNLFKFQSSQNMQSASSEATMTSNTYSVITVFDASATGRIFSINTGIRGTQDLAITLPSAGVMKVINATDGSNFSTVTINLPVTSGPVVVSVSYGSAASDIAVQVNGFVSSNVAVATGSPVASTSALRQLMIGDSSSSSSLQLGELLLFTEQLSPAELNSLSRTAALHWGISGMNYIPYFPAGSTPTIDPLFAQVEGILQTNCASCHGPGTAYPFVGLGASALANSQWVVKGNAAASPLYSWLTNYGSIGGMPQGAPALSSASATALQSWINGLTP